MLTLPEPIQGALAPLFAAVPFEESMPRLVGSHPIHAEFVRQALAHPALADRADLAAGLWLYVDDLDRSHEVSQSLETETGAYWHGIMHRREGDFWNSHYWMRRAARHPLRLERPDLDPDKLVDDVAAAARVDLPDLVQRQRDEWRALLEWCAAQR